MKMYRVEYLYLNDFVGVLYVDANSEEEAREGVNKQIYKTVTSAKEMTENQIKKIKLKRKLAELKRIEIDMSDKIDEMKTMIEELIEEMEGES